MVLGQLWKRFASRHANTLSFWAVMVLVGVALAVAALVLGGP